MSIYRTPYESSPHSMPSTAVAPSPFLFLQAAVVEQQDDADFCLLCRISRFARTAFGKLVCLFFCSGHHDS